MGHTSKFQQASRLGVITALTSLTGGQPSVSWAGSLYVSLHFRGLLPSDGILPGANFTLRPSLAFSYIGSVTARTPEAGVSQTLCRNAGSGITELSQRVPPIFGGAVITLGIGPHSSLNFCYSRTVCCWEWSSVLGVMHLFYQFLLP